MKMFTLTIISGLLLASSALARIGETEPEIIARYGPPMKIRLETLPSSRLHHFQGFDIMITYLDGFSGEEVFGKQDKTSLTTGEIEAILEANKGDSKWTAEQLFNITKWTRGDGATAIHKENDATLIIQSKKYQEHKTSEDQKRPSGF